MKTAGPTPSNRRDQYGLELVLSPLFVDVSASGDVTTRNQQVAQLISGEDKTLYLTQKVVTVRMLGDIAVANGTYTLHHKVNSAQVDEKGVFTHVFERVAWRLALHQLAADAAAPGCEVKQRKEAATDEIAVPHSALLKGRQGAAVTAPTAGRKCFTMKGLSPAALKARPAPRPGPGKQARVLGDAHHGKDFGEVRRQAEGAHILPRVRGLDQQLDHQRDAARVDVIHVREVQQDELGGLLGQRLVGAQDRIF